MPFEPLKVLYMPFISGTIAMSNIFVPIPIAGGIYALKLTNGDIFGASSQPQIVVGSSVIKLSEEPGAGTRCQVRYDAERAGAVAYKQLLGVKLLSVVEAANFFTDYSEESSTTIESLDN